MRALLRSATCVLGTSASGCWQSHAMHAQARKAIGTEGSPPFAVLLKHIHLLGAGTGHTELNIEPAGAAAKSQQASFRDALQIQSSCGHACRSCSRAATRCLCRRHGHGAHCWASGGLRGGPVALSWPQPRQADAQSSSLSSCCNINYGCCACPRY